MAGIAEVLEHRIARIRKPPRRRDEQPSPASARRGSPWDPRLISRVRSSVLTAGRAVLRWRLQHRNEGEIAQRSAANRKASGQPRIGCNRIGSFNPCGAPRLGSLRRLHLIASHRSRENCSTDHSGILRVRRRHPHPCQAPHSAASGGPGISGSSSRSQVFVPASGPVWCDTLCICCVEQFAARLARFPVLPGRQRSHKHQYGSGQGFRVCHCPTLSNVCP